MARRFPASERFRAKLTANCLRADVSYFLCCTQQRKYIKRRLHTGHFDLKSCTHPSPFPSPSSRVSWSALMGHHLGTTARAIRIYALSNGKTYPEIQRCWYNALCFNGEFFCPSSMQAPSESFLLLLWIFRDYLARKSVSTKILTLKSFVHP